MEKKKELRRDIKTQFQCDLCKDLYAVFLKQWMGTVLIYSATKSLCSFSHVKLCTEIQLWFHFLYQLQCRWLSWAESLNQSRYNTCSTITCGVMACWSCVPGNTKEPTSPSPWKPFHIPRKLTLRYFSAVTSSPIQPLFSSMQSVSCSEYSFLVLQCVALHLVMLIFWKEGPSTLCHLDC